ncbi:unnamed protein product, partial [Nesidiocoris tenuis]
GRGDSRKIMWAVRRRADLVNRPLLLTFQRPRAPQNRRRRMMKRRWRKRMTMRRIRRMMMRTMAMMKRRRRKRRRRRRRRGEDDDEDDDYDEEEEEEKDEEEDDDDDEEDDDDDDDEVDDDARRRHRFETGAILYEKIVPKSRTNCNIITSGGDEVQTQFRNVLRIFTSLVSSLFHIPTLTLALGKSSNIIRVYFSPSKDVTVVPLTGRHFLDIRSRSMRQHIICTFHWSISKKQTFRFHKTRMVWRRSQQLRWQVSKYHFQQHQGGRNRAAPQARQYRPQFTPSPTELPLACTYSWKTNFF